MSSKTVLRSGISVLRCGYICVLCPLERVLREIRKLEKDTEQIVLNGSVKDMEGYRFLMGRLDGIHLVEDIIRTELKKYTEE